MRKRCILMRVAGKTGVRKIKKDNVMKRKIKDLWVSRTGYHSGGKDHQTFSSLSYRTFRYVQVTIETGEESLVIDDMYSLFTGYPFTLKGRF